MPMHSIETHSTVTCSRMTSCSDPEERSRGAYPIRRPASRRLAPNPAYIVLQLHRTGTRLAPDLERLGSFARGSEHWASPRARPDDLALCRRFSLATPRATSMCQAVSTVGFS